MWLVSCKADYKCPNNLSITVWIQHFSMLPLLKSFSGVDLVLTVSFNLFTSTGES